MIINHDLTLNRTAGGDNNEPSALSARSMTLTADFWNIWLNEAKTEIKSADVFNGDRLSCLSSIATVTTESGGEKRDQSGPKVVSPPTFRSGLSSQKKSEFYFCHRCIKLQKVMLHFKPFVLQVVCWQWLLFSASVHLREQLSIFNHEREREQVRCVLHVCPMDGGEK